jgi:enoyl-CoA hydratase/carnithine racemase
MSETAGLEADLLYEVRDGIGRITFNRPQARNSLTFNMYERLAEICQRARKDPALTGALYRKPRAFVTKVRISTKAWMHFSRSASRNGPANDRNNH